MARLSSVLTPETNRAHYVAQGTLCVLAGMVVLALAWTGWHGGFSRGGIAPEQATAAGNPLPLPTPATPTFPILSNPVPNFPAPPVLVPPAPLPSVPAGGALRSGRPIENPQVREMVEAAREVRKLGDMQAAIESLRAADLREPDHPEVLSEMALTYEAMGLGEKSRTAWKSVLAMGEPVAGGFYALAKSKLGGLEDAPPAPPMANQKPVFIGSCQVLPDTKVTKGQRLTLRVPIVAAPGADVDAAQMDIHVYFYDKVGKERVEASKADPPEQKWLSQRVDWALHNEELLDIVYNMPELRPEELRDVGKRSYYGYVVKLFYQNRLMSQKADPPSLLDFKPDGPAGVENALFPKN